MPTIDLPKKPSEEAGCSSADTPPTPSGSQSNQNVATGESSTSGQKPKVGMKVVLKIIDKNGLKVPKLSKARKTQLKQIKYACKTLSLKQGNNYQQFEDLLDSSDVSTSSQDESSTSSESSSDESSSESELSTESSSVEDDPPCEVKWRKFKNEDSD